MQLGRKQNNNDLFESLRSEVEAAPAPQQYQQQAPVQNSYSAPAEPAFPMESVHVQIEEKITMVANRDGGLESMEVKGDLMLRVSDPSRAKISLALRHLEDPNIQFKVRKGNLRMYMHLRWRLKHLRTNVGSCFPFDLIDTSKCQQGPFQQRKDHCLQRFLKRVPIEHANGSITLEIPQQGRELYSSFQ
jgi:hypothetical protein